jgi:DNA polymerase-3 subunit alpha
MATFARYGFNKSHSAAYSVVTYQTAWLKANHPREFMAALLTVDSGNMDKVTEALEECRRMDISVLRPDVNRSSVDFAVEGDAIRFGLTSVRGVGRSAASGVVASRPFQTLYDIASKVDNRLANKSTLEALIKAGACDELGGHRAQLVEALDPVLRGAAVEQADRRAGQASLFGDAIQETAPTPVLPEVAPWTERELLALERETTGRYWTSHPLAEHEGLVRTFNSHTTRTLPDCPDGTPVVLGGLLVGLQERIIRSGRNEGKRMARFRIEDFMGTVEGVMFSEAYQRNRDLLAENEVLFFVGDLDGSREQVCVRVDAIYKPETAARELAGTVQINLEDGTDLERLSQVVTANKGTRPLLLKVKPEPGVALVIRADRNFTVDPTPEFIQQARAVAGENAVQLRPSKPQPREKPAWQRRRDAASSNGAE